MLARDSKILSLKISALEAQSTNDDTRFGAMVELSSSGDGAVHHVLVERAHTVKMTLLKRQRFGVFRRQSPWVKWL